MNDKPPLPIWLFIGLLLLIFGILCTIAGVGQWIHPPSTVLAGAHATFWGGLVMTIAGLAYVIVYRPRS